MCMKIYVHNVKAMEQSRPIISRMQVMLVGQDCRMSLEDR